MTPARMAEIHGQSFARGWSTSEITALLERPTTVCTATAHGFALVQILPPEAEILTLAIAPEHRGAGHGRALLARMLMQAQDAGATRVFLEVDARNTAAIALYAAAGFAQSGLRKGYYSGTDGAKSDALEMSFDAEID